MLCPHNSKSTLPHPACSHLNMYVVKLISRNITLFLFTGNGWKRRDQPWPGGSVGWSIALYTERLWLQFPGQGTCLGSVVRSSMGAHTGRQAISVSLFFPPSSPSFPSSLSLSKKSMKTYLQVRILKIIFKKKNGKGILILKCSGNVHIYSKYFSPIILGSPCLSSFLSF